MLQDSKLDVVRNNPKHVKAALEAASWVIYQDDRMRGLPQHRDALIQMATLKALGHGSEAPLLWIDHAENKPIISAAFDKAHEAAKAAIFKHGPLKRKLI
ncbi:MAG: hypothetical protein KDK08_05200 [Rhizobiaceae bacterium]|nr:hypothetical protein [Rhizobiaceae bacterium]MCC0000866.1 hypothetical protein [Methylobacteriaceae bacterium]